MKGKLAYMAPEQILDEPVDRRADVYAAGVVLWELLTQRPLFAGETDAATLRKALSHTPAAPSSVAGHLPSALDDVVLRALARDRAVRFATARDMAQALEASTGVASARRIAEWVDALAGDRIAARRRRFAEIELVPMGGPRPPQTPRGAACLSRPRGRAGGSPPCGGAAVASRPRRARPRRRDAPRLADRVVDLRRIDERRARLLRARGRPSAPARRASAVRERRRRAGGVPEQLPRWGHPHTPRGHLSRERGRPSDRSDRPPPDPPPVPPQAGRRDARGAPPTAPSAASWTGTASPSFAAIAGDEGGRVHARLAPPRRPAAGARGRRGVLQGRGRRPEAPAQRQAPRRARALRRVRAASLRGRGGGRQVHRLAQGGRGGAPLPDPRGEGRRRPRSRRRSRPPRRGRRGALPCPAARSTSIQGSTR